MADRHWAPAALAVQQVETGSIDSLDATPSNNTFTVTVGNVGVSVAGDTDVGTTAAALVAALEAADHPYFDRVTWTNPSSGTIVGTADTAGEPFEATLSVSGAGTGAVTDFTTTTANDGPEVFDSAANWAEGVAPVNSDTLIYADTSVSCRWNLSTGLTGLTLLTDDTFTGEIGLRPESVAITSDGGSYNESAPEYRTAALTATLSSIELGRRTAAEGAGSAMIRVDNTLSGASTMIVHSTGARAVRNAVEYAAAHASADVEIREATGGVGIAVSSAEPTSTVGTVEVSGDNAGNQLTLGAGVTVTNVRQAGGTAIIEPAATCTLVDVTGGTMTINGGSTVTTVNAAGGTVRINGAQTATTINVTNGGTLDLSRSAAARTGTTINLENGTLIYGRNVTIGTLNAPSSPARGHTLVSTPA